MSRHGTAHHIEQMVGNYRRCERRKLPLEERRNHAPRENSWHIDDDECWDMKGRFPPEQGALIQRALEKALEITPRTLPPGWDPGPTDCNYARQLLEQYDREDR